MTSRRCLLQPAAPAADEGAARHAFIGLAAHKAIAAILQDAAGDLNRLHTLDACRALEEADRILGGPTIENRAHRQIVAAALRVYFQYLLPPSTWTFIATEPRLREGRPDALWRDSRGHAVVDEIKTGWNAAHLAITLEQATRYVRSQLDGTRMRVSAVRVLSTADPASSWVLSADGTTRPLIMTTLARPPVRRRRDQSSAAAGRPLLSERGPPPPTM